jgi:hypothetical protein
MAPPPTRPAADGDDATDPVEIGPTVTAKLIDGPLQGEKIEYAVVEGRPPKVIDVPTDDGRAYRYCLADWAQAGSSARYSFLYRV